jgi:hypothetical protein
MSILALTSDTLVGTPGAGQIEYNGQFFGTDSAGSRAQLQRIVQATAVASTSGTSIDFTGLPSWIKRITVMLDQVSLSGTAAFLVQLGDAGGFEITGYSSTVLNDSGSTSNNNATGFQLITTGNANTTIWRGVLYLSLVNTNTFVGTSTFTRDSGGQYGAGRKALSDAITQLRITTSNGTDTFDAGSVNIIYEG